MKEVTTKLLKLVALSAVLAATAVSADDDIEFERLVVFGDSLTDTGNNLFILGTTSQAPYQPIPREPYEGGRYSNGKVWVDFLARELELRRGKKPALLNPKNDNYSFGGARTVGGEVPTVSDQVGLFLQTNGFQVSGDTLFVFNFGGTNVRSILEQTPDSVDIPTYVEAIGSSIDTLVSLGAKHILVTNSPDIGLVPAIPDFARPTATWISAAYNGALDARLSMVDPGVAIYRVDLFGFLNAVTMSPESFGLKDATTPCLTFFVTVDAVCDDARKRLFWDAIHPTKAAHRIIADIALAALPLDDDDEDDD